MIFASGSPYEPVEHKGKVYEPGQGNNMYVFPGIGLGTILSKARHVTDAMVEQASIALSSSLTPEEKSSDLVYPRLVRIRDISAQVALAVIRTAQADVSTSCLHKRITELTTARAIFFYRTWMTTRRYGSFRMRRFSTMSKRSNGSRVPLMPRT